MPLLEQFEFAERAVGRLRPEDVVARIQLRVQPALQEGDDVGVVPGPEFVSARAENESAG